MQIYVMILYKNLLLEFSVMVGRILEADWQHTSVTDTHTMRHTKRNQQSMMSC